jgi:hypothetical protein
MRQAVLCQGKGGGFPSRPGILIGATSVIAGPVHINAIEKGADQPGDLGSRIFLQEMSARDEMRSFSVG